LLRRCLKDNPTDTVAVLVRSRTQLAELLVELRNAGVPYEAVEIDRLTDLPEIIDVLALTRALCHEADRIAWLGLLHGPLVGLSWHDILALVDATNGNSDETVLELAEARPSVKLLSDAGALRLAKFTSTIRHHLRRGIAIGLRERVERFWFALGGPGVLRSPQELDNVYQYFDVLQKFEKAIHCR
jgi:ATP-dependent exoDNAse (exonuclease V) beta subunit